MARKNKSADYEKVMKQSKVAKDNQKNKNVVGTNKKALKMRAFKLDPLSRTTDFNQTYVSTSHPACQHSTWRRAQAADLRTKKEVSLAALSPSQNYIWRRARESNPIRSHESTVEVRSPVPTGNTLLQGARYGNSNWSYKKDRCVYLE